MPKSKSKEEKEPKESQQSSAGDSFQRLPLSSGVLEYIREQNFTRMTPVQAATIPLFLASKDVAVQAVTGSGKTLAFLIPVVEAVLRKKFKKQHAGALILSPTRELAQQTHAVAVALCKHCQLKEPLLLVGGSSTASSSASSRPVTADLQSFQETGHDILIGTPGRVEDILTKYSVIDTSELEYLILDEADVLLNLGFAMTLQSILKRLPKMRRTGLFSATTCASTNSSLKEWMGRAGLRNPVWIDVAVTTNVAETRTAQATPTSLTNYFLVCPLDEKLSRLAAFLQDHSTEKIIVFCLTCACVDFYGNALKHLLPSVSIEPLHGKMVQKRREKSMERFRSDEEGGGTLLCTDVAARGLDVSNVNWVVQFDAPQDPASYVHRVGRSARAGKSGQSLLFITRKEEAYVDLLKMRKVPLSLLPSSERCSPLVVDNTDEEGNKKEASTSKADGTHEDHSSKRTIRCADGSEIDDILPKVKKLVLSDRDFLEKGTKAFTSYIRAYKEHHCSFIFRFASLDLGLLATSFCLLRLPKMPELQDALQKHKGKLPRFQPAGREIDIFAIPYRDKVRETARQKRLLHEQEAGGKNAKQLQAEQKKAEKERKVQERRQKATEKGRNPDKKRGRNARIVDEWDDLAKEERLYKKLRKGKITKEDLEKELNEE